MGARHRPPGPADSPSNRGARGAIVAGFDGGGTKTECWVADLQGNVLGRATAAAGNVLGSGRPALEAALRESLAGALSAAGRPAEELRAVCLALAGYWPGRDAAVTPESFAHLFPEGVQVRLEADITAALQSAVGSDAGVALIAGTGSIAYGRNRQGETARAGGWGYLLGDEGSAYWIGLRALHAALRSHDGREQGTVLARIIPAALGCASPPDLVPLAYRNGGLGKEQVAGLAPLVTEAAAACDAVALQIVEDAAYELAGLVAAVAGCLQLTGRPFPVIAAGGVFRAGKVILDPLGRALPGHAPGAELSQAEMRPAWGAVLLALDTYADTIP